MLKEGDALPLNLLENLTDEFGMVYIEGHNIPKSDLKELFFEKMLEECPIVGLYTQLSKYPIMFSLPKGNFYNLATIEQEYSDIHFPILRPGGLAYLANNVTYPTETVEEIFMNGFANLCYDFAPMWEGEVACVLEKHQVGSFKLVKILRKDMVYWSYGAFYDADYMKTHTNGQHYI
jgi:hypothetical protein